MSNLRLRLGQSLLVISCAALGAAVLAPLDAASAATTATVRTGGGPLNVRSGPTTESTVIGAIADGSQVTLACSVRGRYVNGGGRGTARWDRLPRGGYVSHAFVTGGVPPDCAAAPTKAGGSENSGTGPGARAGSATVATGDPQLPLAIRVGPSTSYQRSGSVPNGAPLAIACQVKGQRIWGPSGPSDGWDRLTSGRYVSHAYVRSGPIASCPAAAAAGQHTAPKAEDSAPKAARSHAGIVRSDDGAVRIRNGPSTGATILRHAPDGGEVAVACAVGGQYVTGTVRTTDRWDRLADGAFISDAYVVLPAAVPTCPGSRGGSGGHAGFISASVAAAKPSQREFGVPVSVSVAQAIIESGWGLSDLTTHANNYFGIKCFDGWYGPIATGCVSYPTVECDPYCRSTTEPFRRYASPSDSFRDHAIFLTTNSRYWRAFEYKHDSQRFLLEVWRAGYATSPTYGDDVISIMRRHNLYQYDGA